MGKEKTYTLTLSGQELHDLIEAALVCECQTAQIINGLKRKGMDLDAQKLVTQTPVWRGSSGGCRRKPMDNGKVHVEIGMDGKKTVSALSGSALELSAAAARILNIFYAAFCQRGIGEEFKETMRCCVNREDSPVWRKEFAE